MQRNHAFTLIELLVVVAIIATLISILVPSLGAARDQTQRVRCRANLRTIGHAIEFYLGENADVMPAAPFYGCIGYVARSDRHQILGSKLPENQRPLNRYLGVENNISETIAQAKQRKEHVFECPRDRGDAYTADGRQLTGTFFIEHGTSYTYASDSRDIDEFIPYPVPTFGIQSCRALPRSHIRFPSRKIVFQEPVFNPMFNMKDARAQWHHTKRHHSHLLFADGHVGFAFTAIFEMFQPPDEYETYY